MSCMNYYRQTTKLRKGNAFSHLCLLVCLFTGVSHVTITQDALDFIKQRPTTPIQSRAPPYMAPPPSVQALCFQDCRPCETCSLEDPLPYWC